MSKLCWICAFSWTLQALQCSRLLKPCISLKNLHLIRNICHFYQQYAYFLLILIDSLKISKYLLLSDVGRQLLYSVYPLPFLVKLRNKKQHYYGQAFVLINNGRFNKFITFHQSLCCVVQLPNTELLQKVICCKQFLSGDHTRKSQWPEVARL